MTVHVMEEVFGDDPEWRPDRVWLPEVTARGWVILMKDDRIRMRPLEREALIRAEAKAFCITNAQITGDEMGRRFVTNLPRILRACRKPGPFVYGVYQDRLARLFPKDPARQR
jgi:hypothetical protein